MTKNSTSIIFNPLVLACVFLLFTCKKKEDPKPLTPEELKVQLEAKLAKMSDGEKWMFRTKNIASKRFQLKGKVATVVETIMPSTTGEKRTYEFDTEGRLTKSLLQETIGGSIGTVADTVITISTNRITTVSEEYNKEKKTIQYDYNPFGNFKEIRSETFLNNTRQSKTKTEYTYINDTLKTQVKVSTYKPDFTTIAESTDTIYLNNKKIKQIVIVKYGATLQDTTSHKVIQYIYDKSDRLESIEEKIRAVAIGEPISKDIYIYDTQGNWIKKEQYNIIDFNEILGSTTERTFTYHQ